MTDINGILSNIENDIIILIVNNSKLFANAYDTLFNLNKEDLEKALHVYNRYATTCRSLPHALTSAILLEMTQRAIEMGV